jgi:endonuclease/exonuclease/phosphatase family metal-dependent hydrolase
MAFFRGFIFTLNFLVAAFSVICFGLSIWLPSGSSLAGFLMLLTPVCLVLNLLFLVYWLIYKWRNAWLSAVLLVFAWPLIKQTFVFNSPQKRNENGFSVLSYNAFYCDAINYVHNGKKDNSPKLINAMASIKSDIKCFQELYNYDALEHFRVIDKIKEQNPNFVTANNKRKGFVGLAIFSRFPILGSGYKKFQGSNGLLWADVSVKGQPLRVMNVQFNSMGIRIDSALKTEEGVFKAETKNIITRLKNGFNKRKPEVDFVLNEIEQSPNPVILVGDFNELPYGYAYGKINEKLVNAFEKAGKGFGFTYNRTPNFIRIDNQFYDNKALKINQFKTLSDVDFSDHYPVWGRYVFE